MKKVQYFTLILIGLVLGLQSQTQAQETDKSIILSELETGCVHMKLSKDGKNEVFGVTVIDEDHSCVVDFCGFTYNNEDKSYKEDVSVLNNNLKEIYSKLGNVEKCAVLKWDSKGIKFTVYGIAPNVAYICVDGHGHGILSKEDVKKAYTWIDDLKNI